MPIARLGWCAIGDEAAITSIWPRVEIDMLVSPGFEAYSVLARIGVADTERRVFGTADVDRTGWCGRWRLSSGTRGSGGRSGSGIGFEDVGAAHDDRRYMRELHRFCRSARLDVSDE